MRISDWSSDVCSSDLGPNERIGEVRDRAAAAEQNVRDAAADALKAQGRNLERQADINATRLDEQARSIRDAADKRADALDAQSRSIRNAADKQADALYEQARARSEEHTSELQSLMRISYAVICLKKKHI